MKKASARERLRRQDDALVAEGFEPLEESELWRKNGILFGRVAALQKLQRDPREAKPPHDT